MQIDRISEIIAHFIGHFDSVMDDARLRIGYTGGQVHDNAPALPQDLEALDPNFASELALKDYVPGVEYQDNDHRLFDVGGRAYFDPLSGQEFRDLDEGLDGGFRLPRMGIEEPNIPIELDERLAVYPGPGSAISHMAQINLLFDDDYLNMTSDYHAKLDTGYVVERLAQFATDAVAFTPFSAFDRTDTYEGLQKIAQEVHEYKQDLVANDTTSIGEEAEVNFVVAGDEIHGTYVNGVLTDEIPSVDELMPDRGLAKPAEDPEESETPLEQPGPQNTLEITAGANVVANIATFITTGVITPVMSVMGNYHQIDVITQAYVYSDNDTNVFAPNGSADEGASTDSDRVPTVALNIAEFDRAVFGNTGNDSQTVPDQDPTYPSDWRVNIIQGDVSFVQWIEQYNFVTDNDQMVVTTTGYETTVLTGGNAAFNITAYLGIGQQYDLVIVGGNVLDMNIISQMAVLYDNDTITGEADYAGNVTTQTGNNLLWNQASILNVGSNDRFETMPDYMQQAQQNILNGDPDMPETLGTDANFVGQEWLNVLYITGNLYDITYIKQMSILGDSDHVTQAASDYLANNQNATVTIDTGSNAIVNIAQIVDYDSFGGSTYVAGQTYSDAILIQGGLVEDDLTQPQPANNQLANEVLAFLDGDPVTPDTDDAVFNSATDLGGPNASPADVMQTMIV
ncbi:MAG: hypothetical protein DI528_04655 [Shinella sp.]|nr:MAG: hypothetical protein DI528_04655 [Shinella sp.]